jgi:hypothetical protein
MWTLRYRLLDITGEWLIGWIQQLNSWAGNFGKENKLN